MYQLPAKPAIVRNIKFHSYKGFLSLIIVLLALNLLKDTNLITRSANAAPVAVVKPSQPDIYPQLKPNQYILELQDEWSIILKDGDGRIVHVFQRSYKPNANLYYVIDRDNE